MNFEFSILNCGDFSLKIIEKFQVKKSFETFLFKIKLWYFRETEMPIIHNSKFAF